MEKTRALIQTVVLRFLLAFGAVLICLVILEIIVRALNVAPVIFDYRIFEPMQFVQNPKICYKMKPFGQCEGGYLNSSGFKDIEFAERKDSRVKRIVMFGDSITKGTGIILGKTFSDQLEYLLNQRLRNSHSGLRYEVMNFGVGGYNIVSEMEVLKVYALSYKPDIVVLNYFYNDNEEYSFNYWLFLESPDISAAEKNNIYQYYRNSGFFNVQRVLLHSQLYVFCRTRLYGAKQGRRSFSARYATYRENIVREKLRELKVLSLQNNFSVLVCLHPTLDYDKTAPHPNYAATQRDAAALHLPYFDLRAAYQKQSVDPQVFRQNEHDVVHPNEAGHRLIAEALLAELEKTHLISF